MNLEPNEIQLNDDDLCDKIGFDTLIRLGLVNWRNQIKRRQDKMMALSEEIKDKYLTPTRH